MNDKRQLVIMEGVRQGLAPKGALLEKRPKENKFRVRIPINDKDGYLVDFSSKVPDGVRNSFVLDIDIKNSPRRAALQEKMMNEEEHIEKLFSAPIIRRKDDAEVRKEGFRKWIKIGKHRRMGFFQFVRSLDWTKATDDEVITEVIYHTELFINNLSTYLNGQREYVSQEKDAAFTQDSISHEENHNLNFINQMEEKHIQQTEIELIQKARIGQSQFKQSLLLRERTCQLCGMPDERFLIASHIKPWKVSSNYEKLDPNNGLLLCPNHDALFDKGYITINDSSEILTSNSIKKETRIFLNIKLKKTLSSITKEQQVYLKWHREHIFKP